MIRRNNIYGFLWLALLFLSSCSTTRKLGENQFLYKGDKIVIEPSNDLEETPNIEAIDQYVIPEPNRKFLKLVPIKLWFYNLAGDSVPSKGFRNWMKNKLGEPPVIHKSYYVETSKKEISSALNNQGFFNHSIQEELKKRGKKVKILYKISVEDPFLVDTLIYPEVADSLTLYLSRARAKSIIKSGQIYNLDVLKAERNRLVTYLKNNGFYFASPNYLLFKADTLSTERNHMDLVLDAKSAMPNDARYQYRINNVLVYHDFVSSKSEPYDTIQQGDLKHIFIKEPVVKPKVISRSVFFKKGHLYNENDYRLTLQKLTNLNVFKFVNIKIDKDTSSVNQKLLNVSIFLNSALPKSLSAEVEAVSKSNDYVGPGLTLSYLERNLYQSASSLQFNVSSNYETQFNQSKRNINSFEVGTDVEVTIPKLLIPFVNSDRLGSKKFRPETSITAGYSYSGMTDIFNLHSLDLSFGYNWQETKTKTHELDLVSLNYTHINTKSDWADIYDYIDESLQEQFILGLKYTFTFNDQHLKSKFINTYFSASSEFAGNTLSLLHSAFNFGKDYEDRPSEIFGTAYSQYAKFDGDLRLYHSFSRKSKIVGRVAAGVAIPYGNSEYMPYNKQFYTGGASSLRAFPSRSVGPGSYVAPESLQNTIGLEQAGDIKLEANLEYRFDLISYLKGAMFVDAGNVWLLHKNEELEGGEFSFSNFTDQIAVGTGLGLRLDASFFVLRLDVAFPIRNPYPINGKNWVLDQVDFGSSRWRKDNLVFNIAFGYPF
ncbi:BamA/TamA family outer membrane protein [Plebeiibacterium sediminum]|uniref:BamA/TamA family outer membrane protein n=1 Tax=Plebeiibacterium sediminum TaxID=2992112 RepID=A0AAE3SFU4_9BACT|nr:BamA/TamA family outer membrane protein [Plebeiobacterium sediminum]MCW3787815.1 BamA/TamA family outer membrane protein [Plebeiobacterium sediminum]